MRQGYTSGKQLLFYLAFPGLDTKPGYALFGAYAVNWIGLINKCDSAKCYTFDRLLIARVFIRDSRIENRLTAFYPS
jgi:hypothetical protein